MRIHLTPRQQEVLDLLGAGMTEKEISLRLKINPRTVRSHTATLFDKIGVNTRTEIAIYVMNKKLDAANAEIERLRKMMCGLLHELGAIKFYTDKMSTSIQELGDIS